jgi:hypothetical protein
MRRFLVGLVIAFFTFTIGVGVSLAWMIVKWHLIWVEGSAIHTLLSKKERTIVKGIAGEGISPEGYPTSFSNSEYSDGKSIQQLSIFYPSSVGANEELQKRINAAETIVRREPVLDVTGRQIGERVVATFLPYKGSSVAPAELLWTENSRYVSQKRSSLQSILDDLDSNR